MCDESARRVAKLHQLPEENVGIEILTLFILDLLGRDTPAARIFLRKVDEDFKSTRVVTNGYKGLMLVAVILINMFFIYYCMLYGFVKGVAWQRAYMFACIIQLVMEVLIVESIECFWIHFAVPDMVYREVLLATTNMIENLEKFFSSSVPNTKYFLNAPAFLFVSTNVCTQFPKMMESIVVKTYFSHLPGELLSRKWSYSSSLFDPTQASFFGLRHLTVFSTLFGLLKVMGSAPFIYHRVVIRLTQPVFVTGATYVFMKYIAASKAGIAVTVVLAVAVGGYLYWRSHRQHTNDVQKVVAVSNTVDMYYVKAESPKKSNTASDSDEGDSASSDDLEDEDLAAPVLQRSKGSKQFN